ncbi:MAG: RnfABCDGE type electron transport complex subunit B [Melioribacter sp.]|nr:RnfABCDGE type electron transport complex subunit B [Melioribacter sp.]
MELTIITAIVTMGGLGFLFSSGLAFADKKLRVEENPLIEKINQILPGANCGACGNAGCYDFAVKVVERKIEPNACPVGGEDVANTIAEILGVEKSNITKLIPRILCNGNKFNAVKKDVIYSGPQSCAVKAIVSGGDKLCYYGCLGGGDCVKACPFGAIIMNDDELPLVIEELCTGCGLCAKACPRNVIEMHPIQRNIFVFCKNQDEPKRAKEVCSVSCIGCGICARKSDGGIQMINNLAIINYEKLDGTKIPFEKCSTGAIKKLDVATN